MWKNKTVVTEFILLGFGNGPELDSLLFLMLLLIAIVTITGNILIIVLMVANQHLHTPMYFFLGNLACLEICYSSFCQGFPRMLVDLLLERKFISFSACVLQLYLVIFFITSVSFWVPCHTTDMWLYAIPCTTP
uniref:G-protein coupled receptors family 1 profile domain-containing protein n=1 Tax=Calidris pygmaea TaxID=425635 RepID=A0A8C3JXC3_9CHAR